ncbi:Tartrate-resistant acid phosphatase type 5 [Quaeritorhiza haematococci]|nr:Tartrate-resistant acid phosphatase type 5 [Quaeritorhiza haematococci]
MRVLVRLSAASLFAFIVFFGNHDVVPAAPVPTQAPQPQQHDKLDFLIIGDWGIPDGETHIQVARAMEQVASYSDPQFLVSVGDNYYESKKIKELNYGGVQDVNDPKWDLVWKQVFTGKISQVPWYIVQGNHDWRSNPLAQVEYSQKDAHWVHPSFFWEKVVTLPPILSLPSQSQEAAFIFIDTQLLAYGYEPSEEQEPNMAANFRKLGWLPERRTLETQLAWIESALERHKDKPYIFVVGHHPLVACKSEGQMDRLLPILMKYSVTAYIFGHDHALQHVRIENTFFVKSGAGAKGKDSCDDGMKEKRRMSWAPERKTAGFARGVVDANGFSVEYYDQNANLIFASETLGPRRVAVDRID